MFTVLLTTNERDADAVNNRKMNENDKNTVYSVPGSSLLAES